MLLDSDAATDILDHLARFEYASLQYTVLTLLWRCGARSGIVRPSTCATATENEHGLKAQEAELGARLGAVQAEDARKDCG